MQVQKIVTVDKKGRIMISKSLRKRLKIKPGNRLILDYSGKFIAIRTPKKVKHNDALLWDLSHPIHVDKKRLERIDLEKLEEEVWSK